MASVCLCSDMAMAVLSPHPPLSKPYRSLQPSLTLFSHRNQKGVSVLIQKKWKAIVSCHKQPTKQNGVCSRRDLVLIVFSTSLSSILPSSSSSYRGYAAEEEFKMSTFVDEINAYSYTYPVELPSNKLVFKWVESRKPERYSSAAPLSPDARLRIVSERVDFIDNLIISVSIGPPNSQILNPKDKSTWKAKDVADSVLADKSALRVTTSQRMDESSVLDAHTSEIDGELYWYYDYLVRKSPTKTAQESNNYRHYVASTAERDGYFYTLNASTLSKQWDMMGPLLEKTVASFRLLPPTDTYVPPYKDPWRFW